MENEKVKTSRASQTREQEARKVVWTPPSSLDAPPAPEGFRHRLIRAESMGFQDTSNMAAMQRSGWDLVRGDEYPDSKYPVLNEGKYAGMIGVGGLVLARIPEEIARSRSDYFKRISSDQISAVDADLMKEQRPGMPINIDRQSRVTFGGGRKQ